MQSKRHLHIHTHTNNCTKCRIILMTSGEPANSHMHAFSLPCLLSVLLFILIAATHHKTPMSVIFYLLSCLPSCFHCCLETTSPPPSPSLSLSCAAVQPCLNASSITFQFICFPPASFRDLIVYPPRQTAFNQRVSIETLTLFLVGEGVCVSIVHSTTPVPF